MPAGVALYMDEERTLDLPIIYFGEVVAPETMDENFEGPAIKLYGKNTGSTNLREVSVSLEGEGASNVRLATDVEGEPGIWAAPGESIMVSADTLFRDDYFEFWARGVFNIDDSEGRKPLNIVFNAISTE